MTSATTTAQIAAVARRDAHIELSYHFQLVMRYVTTVFGVAVFFFIGKLVDSPPELAAYEGGYFSFALIGLIMMSLANVGLREVSRTFTGESASGTLEILLTGRTPLGYLMLGSLILPFSLAAVDLVLYLGVGYMLGGVDYPLSGVLIAVPALVLTVSTFVAFGTLATAFLVLTRRGEPFSVLALQTTNLLAGTVFPVAVLPFGLQVAAHLIPAFYGLRVMRDVLLGDLGLAEVWPDLGILVVFNAILIPLSMWVLRKALHTTRVTGTLVSG